MILLALLLVVIGVADAVRHVAVPRTSPLAASWATGVGVTVLGAWGLALGDAWWWVVPGVVAVLTWWLVVPDLTWPRARSWGLFGLAVAGVGALALDQRAGPGRGFLVRAYDSLDVAALHGVDVEHFLLAVAVLVFLHSSANVVVRLVLADSGPHVLDSEQTLKGGRILGPLERWFIFAMALAGQYAAITAVVAAKGIVRFPEISRGDTTGTKAEYVLVGSFVSWSLALLFVPLLK